MRLPVLLILFFVLAPITFADDQPEYIDDQRLKGMIEEQAGQLIADEKTIANAELQAQLNDRRHADLAPPKPFALTQQGEDLYDKVDDGVLIIARIYLCGRCDKSHANCASGFVVSEDGLAVTNHHVMKSNDEKTITFVAMTRDRRVVPIVEVLASEAKSDIALIRLAGEGFTPVPIARSAKVGQRVHAVTNPSGRFYTYSSGEISRFFIKPKSKGIKRITVTCDYGGGSSGGPIFNDQGQVVAVVSEAVVIPDNKIVHYDSVPYSAILDLFKPNAQANNQVEE